MTEKPKWSPAPWLAIGPDSNIHIVQANDPDMRVCFMTSNGPCVANAHLIAASPVMAEALEEALNYIHSLESQNQQAFEKIDAVIHSALSLARGE